jgi:peptide/nickel transport system permease protein
LILQRLPATLELAGCAFVLSIIFGIPLGMLAGIKAGKLVDRVVMTGSIFGFSLPTFWQGMLLVMVFAVWLGWLPSSGRGDVGSILGIKTSLATSSGLAHLILPAINLALYQIALLIRLVRSGMRETLPLDFVRFARAKGLSESRVIWVHVFKNMMIPIVTVIGLEIGRLISFAVVTETIFAWPGVGKLLVDSIVRLDRPVIVAYLLVVVAMFIVINLIVDIVYSILDPRIRLGGS